jgi:hypothetical protein
MGGKAEPSCSDQGDQHGAGQTQNGHHKQAPCIRLCRIRIFCMSLVQYLLNRQFALSVLVKNLFSAIVLTANQT